MLKTSHACGTVLLVEDKTKLDVKATRKKLSNWLNLKMGIETAEPHYLGIKPLIIAEEYLKVKYGEPIVDYKLYTVKGVTELIMVCSERKIGVGSKISLYDSSWNFCPEKLGQCHANDNVQKIPQPKSFEKMKEYAKILCEDFPFVRMDFYDIDGKVYFGELTFTPSGGFDSGRLPETQIIFGNKVNVS